MHTYHVRTETRSNLADLAGRYFDGFTLIEGAGYWQGQRELSTTIELVTDDGDRVLELARAIKVANGQDAVLVERQESTSTIV